MKYPIFVLAAAGAAPNQLDKFVPRDWKGELAEDLFQAQPFPSAAAAARRLDEMLKMARGDLRALAIYQITGLQAQRLSTQDHETAKEQALDEDLRTRMTPELREYFQRMYVRR